MLEDPLTGRADLFWDIDGKKGTATLYRIVTSIQEEGALEFENKTNRETLKPHMKELEAEVISRLETDDPDREMPKK